MDWFWFLSRISVHTNFIFTPLVDVPIQQKIRRTAVGPFLSLTLGIVHIGTFKARFCWWFHHNVKCLCPLNSTDSIQLTHSSSNLLSVSDFLTVWHLSWKSEQNLGFDTIWILNSNGKSDGIETPTGKYQCPVSQWGPWFRLICHLRNYHPCYSYNISSPVFISNGKMSKCTKSEARSSFCSSARTRPVSRTLVLSASRRRRRGNTWKQIKERHKKCTWCHTSLTRIRVETVELKWLSNDFWLWVMSPPWIKTENTLDHTWLIIALHEAIKQF